MSVKAHAKWLLRESYPVDAIQIILCADDSLRLSTLINLFLDVERVEAPVPP
jgi:hypothetical protein